MDFDDAGGGEFDEAYGDTLEEYAAVFGQDESTVETFLGKNEADAGRLAPVDGKVAGSSGENATATALESLDYELPPVGVNNLIAGVKLGCEIDLRLVTIAARNIEYNPKKMNAAILRLQRPKVTCLIFQNGRISVCGATTISDARRGAKIAAKVCKKAGHPDARFINFKVETLICSASCGFPVRLENLARDHAKYCNYEPEIFCGLVYRYNPEPSLSASVLIFVSGKLVITGCRKTQDADKVYRDLYALLYQYRA